MIVGYKLIDNKTGEAIQTWGGKYGEDPGIPSPLVLPNGDVVLGLKDIRDFGNFSLVYWEMSENERPKKIIFDGADFLARVTDDEYVAITKSDNIQVQRWLDIFRLRGEIDVTGKTAEAAKEGLIALGLLTKERAEEIFKPE